MNRFALLQTNEGLLAENQSQLARVKQMCEAGLYTIEESVDRRHSLEETIAQLEHERDELEQCIEHGLSDDDVENLVAFAHRLAAGLEEADRDFAKRLQIVELLDVRGILTAENGARVCNVSFMLTGESTQRLVLPSRRGKLPIKSAVP
jgi:hypothetical protein